MAPKPVRPDPTSGREPITVPGLPAPAPAPTPVPAATPPAAPPAPYPGVRGYGQPRPASARKGRGGTRPDPPGMSRESYYVTEASAAAIEAAIGQVREVLGDDVPKHVILSALLHAGAERAPEVAARIAAQQTDELTARLAALRNATS
jgi:hypothetical protein